jgi:hypothetical protein
MASETSPKKFRQKETKKKHCMAFLKKALHQIDIMKDITKNLISKWFQEVNPRTLKV